MTWLGIFRTGLLTAAIALAGCDGNAESASNIQDKYDALVEEHDGIKSFAPSFPRTKEQYEIHSEAAQKDLQPVTYRDPGQTNLQQYGLLIELETKSTRDRYAGKITREEARLIHRILSDDIIEIQRIEDLTRSAGALMDYQEEAIALRKAESGGN